MQILWVKLECPQDGSLKQLCISFFIEIDLITAGWTQYTKMYGRKTLDEMIGHVAFICGAHGIGVLALDEVNNLSLAGSKHDEKMLKALLSLSNQIGVFVILIGTYAAQSVLERRFQIARRSCEIGSIPVDRLSYDLDGDLELFMKAMWRYQYLKTHTKLGDEFSKIFYDESQGIHALIVTLYMLTQLRALRTGQERITAPLIRKVAADHFRPVRPLLDALRLNRPREELIGLDDLLSHFSIEDSLVTESSASADQPSSAVARSHRPTLEPSSSTLPLFDWAKKGASDGTATCNATSPNANSKVRRSSKRSSKRPSKLCLVAIARGAARKKLSVHEAFKKAGMINDITATALKT